MTDYQLIRSNRRTLSISVNGEGALVVRAPLHLPQAEIDVFLTQKRSWIEEKQALAHPRFVLEDGAQMPWAGGWLTVRLSERKTALEQKGCLLLPTHNPVSAALKWRRERAQQLLEPRIRYWAGMTGLAPSSVGWSNAKTRWGSMTTRRALRLNTALIHCAPEYWDYVIVHELCHIRHPNHSPAFHAQVRAFLPQADSIRQQMKQLGYVTNLLRS